MVSPTYAGGYRARAVFPWPFLVAVYVIRLMHTRKTRVFLYGVELTRALKDAGVDRTSCFIRESSPPHWGPVSSCVDDDERLMMSTSIRGK
jgi:hypothetical protein